MKFKALVLIIMLTACDADNAENTTKYNELVDRCNQQEAAATERYNILVTDFNEASKVNQETLQTLVDEYNALVEAHADLITDYERLQSVLGDLAEPAK